MKKRIGLQGFFMFLGVVAILFCSKYIIVGFRQQIVDELLDALGMLIVLLGYFLRIAARGCKTDMNPDGKTLVMKGPYALMRNPMYFGTLLIGLGVVLILFRWWVGLVFLGIYLAIYIPQINREENKLSSLFGDTFAEYCKKTPQFFPGIIALFTTHPRDYLCLKLSWIRKERFSLIIIFCVIEAIESWEDLRLFGYIKYQEELLKIFLVAVAAGGIYLVSYKKNGVSGKD
ncbi:MAG: isoprenylcysteine carboxylmethyltransferase family protein [Candidatus Omnitrophota bacterium]